MSALLWDDLVAADCDEIGAPKADVLTDLWDDLWDDDDNDEEEAKDDADRNAKETLTMVPWRANAGDVDGSWADDRQRLVPLGVDDALEFTECKAFVDSTLPSGLVVTLVERVENAMLHRLYLAKRSSIASANNGDANRVLAFHGTRFHCPRATALSENGIDYRHLTHGRYGRASRFSYSAAHVLSDASTVAEDGTDVGSSAKQFLVCEVARGVVEEVSHDGSNVKLSARHHCMEGDVDNRGRVTLCFSLHQAYPRYLVTVDVA